jgi:hypothetical protein
LGEAVGGGGGAPGGVRGRQRCRWAALGAAPIVGGRRRGAGGRRGSLGRRSAVAGAEGSGSLENRERREENEPRGMSASLHKTIIPVSQSKGQRELTYPRRPVLGPTGVNLSPSVCVRADGS